MRSEKSFLMMRKALIESPSENKSEIDAERKSAETLVDWKLFSFRLFCDAFLPLILFKHENNAELEINLHLKFIHSHFAWM